MMSSGSAVLFPSQSPVAASVPVTAQPPAPAQRRIPGLDGIRGIAVALVLLYHFFIYHRTYAVADPLWLRPFARLFDVGSSMGWTGVELFFVLSGFLITGILDDARGRAGYFKSFYSRRALRILPLYYAVLAIHLLVFARETLPTWANIRFITDHQSWYWLFLTNFLFASPAGWHRLTSHFWTLAVEEQFYLVWPLLVCWLDRPRMMRLCLFVLCGTFLLRVLLLRDGLAPQVVYLITPTELDGLVAGAFMALAVREPDRLPALLRRGRALTRGAALLLCAVILARHGLSFSDPVMTLVGYTSLAIVFTALTLSAAREDASRYLRLTLANPVLTFLGRYSYGIYLLHMPIIQLWRAPQRAETWLISDGMAPFAAHLCYVLTVSTSVVGAALVSWYLLERPLLALRPRAPA